MLQCLFRKLVSFSLTRLNHGSRSTCVCVCVSARELLLLYSTCEDIRLHSKSAKHRNKYLKEFSYNMQMSTRMHTHMHINTHTHMHAHALTPIHTLLLNARVHVWWAGGV